MTYEPFSIVVVPFPFTDKAHVKRRPALVVSHKRHQMETEHVTLLMITSAKHSSWESDYLIEQLKSTGLHSSSIIRQKLFTIDARLIIGTVGKLSVADTKKVNISLLKHIALRN